MPIPCSLRRALAVMLVFAGLGSASAAAAPGELDTSWGSAGLVTARNGSADGLAVDAGGKVVVADASAGAVRRYRADGTPDPSFGNDGIAPVDGGPVAVQIVAGGKILVAGTIYDAGTGHLAFWAARLNTDGTPDRSFGGGTGEVSVLSPDDEDVMGFGLAAGPGGIVVAGTAGSARRFAAVRLTGAGVPDSSFGTNGYASVDVGTDYQNGQGVVVEASGRIVIAGQNATDLVLAALTPTGTLDETFGTGGLSVLDAGSFLAARSIALTPDGRLLVGGFADDAMLVARFDADGRPDATCGSGGRTDILFDGGPGQAYAVGLQANGKIVAAGRAGDDWAVVRLLADCTLDTTFDGDGKRVDAVQDGGGARAAAQQRASVPTQAQALAFQADGNFVVGGLQPGDTNVLYMRRYVGDAPAVVTPMPTPTTTPTPLLPSLTPVATPTNTPAPTSTVSACAADGTKPRLRIVSRQDKTLYRVGEIASVRIIASDSSGLAIDPSVTSRRVATTKPGTFTVTSRARDLCGNPAVAHLSYRVAAPPTITVAGVQASCVDHDFKVSVSARSGIGVARLTARRGTRTLFHAKASKRTFVVHASALRSGHYTLVFTARDRAGNTATRRSIFARCARVTPTFTG